MKKSLRVIIAFCFLVQQICYGMFGGFDWGAIGRRTNEIAIAELKKQLETLLLQDDLSKLDPEESPLVDTCLYKDDRFLPQLEQLLRKKADPNTDWLLTTPLSCAVFEANEQAVEILLKSGASPNIQNVNVTPLNRAVEYGNVAIVRLLLQYKADIRGNTYTTPIITAVDESDISNTNENRWSIVRLLLQAGANPFKCDYNQKHVFATMGYFIQQYAEGFASQAKENLEEYIRIGRAIFTYHFAKRDLMYLFAHEKTRIFNLSEPIVKRIMEYVLCNLDEHVNQNTK